MSVILLFQLLVVASIAQAELVELKTNTPLRAVYLLSTPDQDRIFVYPVFIASESDYDGPEGLGHYLEHLMYWHADKVNDKQFHARSGNAWINGLVTSYFNIGGRQEFDDMMEFSRRLLTKPTLDRKFMLDERKVVAREYDFRVSDSPRRQMWSKIWPKLLPENPVSRSVIGTPQSIGSLTIEQATGFHEKYYNPANMVLVVSGNLKAKDVRQKVETVFGKLEAGNPNPQGWRQQQPVGPLDETISLNDRHVTFPSVVVGAVADWKGRGDRAQDAATTEILYEILGSALEGSPARPLRMENFVFKGYKLDVWSVIDGQALFYFSGRLDKGVTADEGTIALRKALKDISAKGIPQKSIDRMRKRLTRRINRLANNDSFVVNNAARNLSLGFKPESATAYIARLSEVTKEDIDGLMRAIVAADRRVTAKVLPVGG